MAYTDTNLAVTGFDNEIQVTYSTDADGECFCEEASVGGESIETDSLFVKATRYGKEAFVSLTSLINEKLNDDTRYAEGAGVGIRSDFAEHSILNHVQLGL